MRHQQIDFAMARRFTMLRRRQIDLVRLPNTKPTRRLAIPSDGKPARSRLMLRGLLSAFVTAVAILSDLALGS